MLRVEHRGGVRPPEIEIIFERPGTTQGSLLLEVVMRFGYLELDEEGEQGTPDYKGEGWAVYEHIDKCEIPILWRPEMEAFLTAQYNSVKSWFEQQVVALETKISSKIIVDKEVME